MSEVLDVLAKRIRTLYVRLRAHHLNLLRESKQAARPESDGDPARTLHPRWDGGVDEDGRRHQPIWPRLAAFAVAQQLHADAWVETLFEMAGVFDHKPRPSDLKDRRVVQHARDWRDRTRRDVYHGTRTEILTALREQWDRKRHSALSDEAVARTVVADPFLELTALVRYVHAAQYRQDDLARYLEADAAVQYAPHADVYRELFGARLPKRLSELADALLGDYTGGALPPGGAS